MNYFLPGPVGFLSGSCSAAHPRQVGGVSKIFTDRTHAGCQIQQTIAKQGIVKEWHSIYWAKISRLDTSGRAASP